MRWKASAGLMLFLSVVLLPAASLANSIHGTVTASAHRTPIANARVTLSAGGHEQTCETDAAGQYQLSNLAPTLSYELVIEADGLRPYSQEHIVLGSEAVRQIDVNLDLSSVQSSVVVTPGGVVNLDAGSAEISQIIDSTEIRQLPSVTHAVAKYALLDPHVLQPLALGADYQDANRLSINSASYRHTGYMLDGTTNYDWVYANNPQATVAPVSVESVKVLTGDYSAQYGNSTAGLIVVTTAAGTSQPHGDFFSYIRPSGPQASPFLATRHIPNQKLDYGGSLGGPVVRRSNRAFVSYERVQQMRGSVITSPTPGVYDGQSNEYSLLGRLDRDFTPNNTLSVRLNGNHYAADDANDRIASYNDPTYGRIQRIQSWGGQVSDRAILGDKVNVLRFTYTSYIPDSARPLSSSMGVVVPNYLQAGNSTYSWVHAQSETYGELLAFRRGHHDLTFGGEFEHLHARDYSYSQYGTYYYNTANDYLNQNPYKYMQTYGVADVHYGQKELSAFAQDDYHVTPRFTASMGVRYEFQSITDSLHNFGPRLGLAWDARGDGKTIVRVGGGIFFDQYYLYLNRRYITLGPNSPQYNYTWDCTASPNPCPTYPNSVAQPANGTQSATVGYLYIPASQLLNPYSLQFSASVEHEIAPNTVLTVSGLQVHTLHQMRVNDINHPAPFNRTQPGQVRTVAEANTKRPYYQKTYDGISNVTLIDMIENTASSVFQSLDIALHSRMRRWGEVNAHYMLAGSYAYAMFYADYNSGVPNDWVPNWNNDERGPSDFYERNRFVGDAVLHGPARTTLALVGTFGSGLPVNPITGVDNNGDGYTVDRPVGFSRDSFRTPAHKTVDVSLQRTFALPHNLRFDARVQSLNVLNSKNFILVNNTYGNAATPSATFLAPQAGIGNTNPSRQIEFVAHVRF